MDNYTSYILEQTQALLAIDSPSGFTGKAVAYLAAEYEKLGYEPQITEKGGLFVELGGEGNPLILTSHVDTLGAMVAQIKDNGRIRITPVGGLNANNTETENCRLYTFDERVYTGTLQLENASIHVNGDYNGTSRTFDTLELLLDEPVSSKEEVQSLGIMNGNYVCVDPRTVITSSGYIKSRFLDDKLSTAIILGYAKYLKEEKIIPERKVYLHVTVFEEVGHGGAGSIPSDVTEILSLDMGCVGNGLDCTERQVSICVKDSSGPSNYTTVCGLVDAAKKASVDFATDVYPHYGSDADAALRAGHDMRHGLIGPGVYASHGYERSHVDGVKSTLDLLISYTTNV